MEVFAENKKAYFHYEVLETIEAGIELLGFEVKSIKSKRANLTGSFSAIHGGELFLTNVDIPPYQPKNTPEEYNPRRSRRLLVTQGEIKELLGKLGSGRLTVVPLKLYNKHGKIKALLGLVRGKRVHEKREKIKKREVEREMRGATRKSFH